MKHLIVCAALLLSLTACELNRPPGGATPTVEALVTPSATATTAVSTPTAAPQASPSPVTVIQIALDDTTPTATVGAPTETATVTPTPGPIQHTIAEGETLSGIVSRYGHNDLAVIDMVVRMNANIPNPDSLPGAGTVILIPRPTLTPTPAGYSETQVARATLGGGPSFTSVQDMLLMEHTVLEGQTIIGIAGEYNTTLEVLDQLNPELQFFNCDFANPSGGPDCNVSLSVGQQVSVPAPTPTPTLSPTPSGSETPTPTPTFTAPMTVFPPEGGVAPPAPITLQWVSVGVLPPDYVYLVEVEDTTAGTQSRSITRDTLFRLSDALIPADGQPHVMRWRIRVAMPTETGTFRPVSADGVWRTFTWSSR